jgi:ankyrin repeat protein
MISPAHSIVFTLISVFFEAYPEAAREKDARGQLPIHIAFGGTYNEIINALLTAPPNGVREKVRNGWTSLHYASSRDYLDLVLLLLNRGADPNVTDNSG